MELPKRDKSRAKLHFTLVGSLFVKDRNKDASLPRRSQVCALTLTRGNFYYTLSGIEPSLDFFRELIVTGSKENFNVHATYRSTNLQRRNFRRCLRFSAFTTS